MDTAVYSNKVKTSLNLFCLLACLHCSSLLAAAHTGLHEQLILLFVEYYHHHSHCTPGSDALGGGASPYSPGNIIPPSPSNSDRANHSLRSYHKPSMPSSHVPQHIVKPLPSFKMTNQMTGSVYQPSSPTHHVPSSEEVASPISARKKRPPRQQATPVSPNLNNLSTSREDLHSSMMTHSTEQLSAEMANIDCIMQDLNAIKDGFEMA
ncbi:hypothetical protein EB796_003789 [Bugula neritina]|uniref:Neogenin C-terminal domain-containing protein n=1 Tax=Bugula neritina TaxID=10212 RepID=A0A7J7KH45_BUGNE|nr:hypothetical protein EB796_003789 [Bugula neritina]